MCVAGGAWVVAFFFGVTWVVVCVIMWIVVYKICFLASEKETHVNQIIATRCSPAQRGFTIDICRNDYHTLRRCTTHIHYNTDVIHDGLHHTGTRPA